MAIGQTFVNVLISVCAHTSGGKMDILKSQIGTLLLFSRRM